MLEFTDDALVEIAKKAIERKTGARGLRSILEALLLDTMYEIPDMEDLEKVVINGETVKEEKPKPVYVYSKKKKEDKEKKSSKSDKSDSKESKEASN